MMKRICTSKKKGKLPAKTVSKEYALEYGTATIEMHQDALQKGQKVVIVDDLLATGGTAKGHCRNGRRNGSRSCSIGLFDRIRRFKKVEKY